MAKQKKHNTNSPRIQPTLVTDVYRATFRNGVAYVPLASGPTELCLALSPFDAMVLVSVLKDVIQNDVGSPFSLKTERQRRAGEPPVLTETVR